MIEEMNLAANKEEYMKTILGQKTPFEFAAASTSDRDEAYLQLLRADSLWNMGKATEAADLVSQLKQKKTWNEEKYSAFARGLEELTVENGSLEQAFVNFCAASRESEGLEAVFFCERAVNVAFWMACTGKMLEAGERLASLTDTTPFAGGILSFAIHMSGDSTRAEKIARDAIQKGFDDPWTLHAVAHALYSLGRSKECAAWLTEHRRNVQGCSAFMKGHMEFHLALCLCDMEDSAGLTDLINGPMWSTMPKAEQEDYWNATGLLNLLWKAELRGMAVMAEIQRNEALSIVTSMGGESTDSPVFSLCIFRWSTGVFREGWKNALVHSDNHVLGVVAQAVEVIYANGKEVDLSSGAWKEAARILAPVTNQLEKLGASPEQREVIEDFVGVVGKRSEDINVIDLASWDKRNRRPSVAFYEYIYHSRGS